MKRVSEWLKEQKKLIIVSVLIVALIIIVFLFFGGENSSSAGTAKTAEELRLTALLERMDGVGDADVMITEDEGGIAGVVVVCDGADRIMVRNDILNAVSTALNINKNIIAIYSM